MSSLEQRGTARRKCAVLDDLNLSRCRRNTVSRKRCVATRSLGIGRRRGAAKHGWSATKVLLYTRPYANEKRSFNRRLQQRSRHEPIVGARVKSSKKARALFSCFFPRGFLAAPMRRCHAINQAPILLYRLPNLLHANRRTVIELQRRSKSKMDSAKSENPLKNPDDPRDSRVVRGDRKRAADARYIR